MGRGIVRDILLTGHRLAVVHGYRRRVRRRRGSRGRRGAWCRCRRAAGDRPGTARFILRPVARWVVAARMGMIVVDSSGGLHGDQAPQGAITVGDRSAERRVWKTRVST